VNVVSVATIKSVVGRMSLGARYDTQSKVPLLPPSMSRYQHHFHVVGGGGGYCGSTTSRVNTIGMENGHGPHNAHFRVSS
jgi:hypothetical protein